MNLVPSSVYESLRYVNRRWERFSDVVSTPDFLSFAARSDLRVSVCPVLSFPLHRRQDRTKYRKARKRVRIIWVVPYLPSDPLLSLLSNFFLKCSTPRPKFLWSFHPTLWTPIGVTHVNCGGCPSPLPSLPRQRSWSFRISRTPSRRTPLLSGVIPLHRRTVPPVLTTGVRGKEGNRPGSPSVSRPSSNYVRCVRSEVPVSHPPLPPRT